MTRPTHIPADTKVAVLMGGWSAERDVSLASGKACARALQEKGYQVTCIDPDRDLATLIAAIKASKADVIFNALHGRWGEDGRIQALLDMLAIPYTHSGVMASAIAMDKPLTNHLLAKAGIGIAKGLVLQVDRVGALKDHPMPPPYVMKPAHEGSSVGIHIVMAGDPLPDLSNWAFGGILVEEYIPGLELTVGVMGDRPLTVTELRPHQGFYDYKAKYTDGMTTHLCPAPISPTLHAQCLQWALLAHETIGCRGVSRSDFRYDPDGNGGKGRLIMLEINTQPGMTDLSLIPEQARAIGLTFPDLMQWMVENAQCDG